MEITFLVENNSRIDRYLLAEPALSIFIETEGKKILFDCGYSDVFIKNALKLSVNLENITDIVISHGHDDHTGGLKFLNLKNKNIKLTAHPNIFDSKTDSNNISYGCPVTKTTLEQQFILNLTKDPYFLTKNLCFLGQIENNSSEDIDDSALVYKSAKGLVIITGCSHSGIINIIEYAKKVTGSNKIFAIVGGLHLLDMEKSKIKEITSYLKKEKVEFLYPCHCCDLNSKIVMAQELEIKEVCSGDRISF
ncbi:metallo-beta-lactamase superfamily protein [Brachyspira sp. CAG:484]|nr:metallo-beta-lactamase superfamily protein [Brachyspira sp. CAG:484]